MQQIFHIAVIFHIFLFLFQQEISAQTLAEKPYQITFSVINGKDGSVSDSIKTQIGKTVEYCRSFIGRIWNIQTEYPDQPIDTEKIDWNKYNCDKIFFITLNTALSFDLQEIDIQLRRCGTTKRYEIYSSEKLPDLLFQALLKHFSPIAATENSSSQTAVLRIQGSGIPALSTVLPSLKAGSILIPFVRTYNRDISIVSAEQIPYTVLQAESVDGITQLLKCRIISGVPNALSAKRRGHTEIFAAGLSLAEQEEMKSVRIKVQLPAEVKIIPVYDIYEVPFDEKDSSKKPVKIGQSSINGVFEIPAEPDKLLRIIQIRSGNSILAIFPVIRYQQKEIIVPVVDSLVRTEAETYLKGLQDEFLDTSAKKIILQKRLEKIKEKTADENNVSVNEERKIQNNIMNLKSKERFLTELEQGRQRFRSDIPAVQQRIEQMFRETEKQFRTEF